MVVVFHRYSFAAAQASGARQAAYFV
ncbi:protein of unknown function [Nitratireductor aquimarinus]